MPKNSLPEKKIVIDAYPIASPYEGLGVFCKQIGERLGMRASELRSRYNIGLYFILPPECKGCFGNDVHYLGVPLSLRFLLPFYPIRADLFHIPYQCNHIKSLFYAKKQLMTVHDINFIYEKSGKKLDKAVRKFEKKLKKSDYLEYISEFAKKDTEKHFGIHRPSKIIYNGITYLPAIARDSCLPDGVPPKFLFHISSLMPKKNVDLLVEMMKYLPEENLLIVGNWSRKSGQSLYRKIQETNTGNIYTLPNVTEEEKAALYKACRAFLFPSLCEGFGMPPIEAMKFGKPVFLSTLTSLPEIGGDAAFYWKDLTPKAMAETVKERMAFFDATPSYTEKIIKNASRFNWDDCVEQYIRYYIEIIN